MLIDVVFPLSSSLYIDPSILKGMLRVEASHYLGIPEHENALNWLTIDMDECAQGKALSAS